MRSDFFLIKQYYHKLQANVTRQEKYVMNYYFTFEMNSER